MSLFVRPEPEPDGDAIQLFMQRLGASREDAKSLVSKGHTSIEEVAYVPINELRECGIEDSVLEQLRIAARNQLWP